MKRFVLIATAAAVILPITTLLFISGSRPSAIDYRLARGRSLLETENYLEALQALREIPATQKRRAETHSAIGAAYFRLHLYGAAITEFEAAAKIGRRDADPRIWLASTYIKLGNPSKALEEAQQATGIEQESPDALIVLGRAYWLQREFSKAEEAAMKARVLDPKSPAPGDLLIHVYFEQNDFDKFQAELDRIKKPDKATQELAIRFHLRRGQFARAYDLKNRYEREQIGTSALESELALKREPSRTDLIPGLIKNLVRIGRFNDAIALGERHRSAVPIDLELGKAYWMAGRKDPAIAAYSRASAGLVHQLSAEVALAAITGQTEHWQKAFRAERPEMDYFVLAQLDASYANSSPLVRAFILRYAGIFEPSLYGRAAEEALRVLDDDPINFDALITIGTAYQRLGRLEDAERYVRRAQEAYPTRAEAVSRLASLALGKGEKDTAKVIALMERAILLDPENAGAVYNLGWIYDQIGETAKAIALYEKAIQASPLSFEAMNNLALIYGQRGQPDRALELLQRAVRTDPQSDVGYFNLASYYSRQRDWRNAIESYRRVLELNPENSVAAIEKGRLHLDDGRSVEAVDALNLALDLDAQSFDAYMVLSSAYEKMGRTREAIAALEEAQRIKSDSPEAAAALARLNSRKDSPQ